MNARGSRPIRIGSTLLLVFLFGASAAWRVPAATTAASDRQQAPRAVCAEGTPNERIEGIIAVLIGYQTVSDILVPDLAGASPGDLLPLCPGLAILPYLEQDNLYNLTGVPPAEIWTQFMGGDALTTIAMGNGVDRSTLVETLRNAYGAALDRALAEEILTDGQRNRLAGRILPHFGWIVDYAPGDAVFVAAGEVDGDGRAGLSADILPGATDDERGENAIRLLFGLPVAGLDLTDPAVVGTANGGIWRTFGAAAVAALVPDGGLAPDDIYGEYLAGKSLLEIHTEHGGDPATLTERLTAVLDETLDAAVGAGDLTPEDRAQVEPVLESALVSAAKHRVGDPLPSDLLSANPLTESPASLAAAAPTCQGVPATIVASGPNRTTSGGPWADVILGTTGHDVLLGNGGSDLICGLAGDDNIEGNQGSDALYGGADGDLIYGEAGALVLTGGGDTIYGDGGNDVLIGQVGEDTIYGEDGADELEGGDGDDFLHGGDGDDDLDGDSGSDTCTGGNGNDNLSQC